MARERIAGAALLVAGAGILVAEAVSAAAWTHPTYSYFKNYISDLEVAGPVTIVGNTVHSPLWLLMSAAYVVNGILVVAALIALGTNFASGRIAVGVVITGIAYGLGIAFDGFFHETIFSLHEIGALCIGVGGNLSLILLGVLGLRNRWRRPSPQIILALGVVGLLSFFWFPFAPHDVAGLIERIAAYPLFLSQLGVGLALLGLSPARLAKWTQGPSLRLLADE